MKMKRLLIFCVLFTAFFISSQAFCQFKTKYLIGKWNPVKVEKTNVVHVQQAANAASDKTRTGTGTTTGNPNQATRVNEQVERFIASEERSSLTINADKTAVKVVNGRSINAKWKLSKHNTRITAKSTELGRKLVLDILRLNDTSAVVMAHYPFGDMKITYKKDKTVK